jgi:hypothetical protein
VPFVGVEALPRFFVYRESSSRQSLSLSRAELVFAESQSLPSAGSRQRILCREPDIWRSAKHMTLGKDSVSGSVCDWIFNGFSWFHYKNFPSSLFVCRKLKIHFRKALTSIVL